MSVAPRALVTAAVLFLGLTAAHGGLADDPADFVVAASDTAQANPAVAYDPGLERFFVVWSDDRNKVSTGYDIYGRFVDSEGGPAGPDIAVSRAPKGQAFATMAVDTLNHRFLVVWTDWRDAQTADSDIYGQVVNADGTLLGESFAVTRQRVSQKFPVAAFDPANRRFLVAWVGENEQREKKVYARFLGQTGEPLSPEFPVYPGGGGQDGISLTYQPGRDRFLVVWRDTVENGVYGAFTDAGAGMAGARFAISLETERVLPPTPHAAAYAPGDDRFLAAWTSRENERQRGMEVYGAMFSGADGTVQGPPFLIATAPDHQRYASLAYDPARRRFLVVWYDLRRSLAVTEIDIYGRFVSADGTMAPEFVLSDGGAAGARRYPMLSFSPARDAYLAVWEDGRDRGPQSRRIFGRRY